MSSHKENGIWSGLGGYGLGGLRPPDAPIRVLVVDDHAGYRRGLRAMLELESDIEPVGEAGDGPNAIEQVERLRPDIVLMDMNMPGADGLEVTRTLRHSYPNLGIIILTMFSGDEYLREARRAGASAYVLKDAGSDLLLETLRAVVDGDVPIMQHEKPIGTGPLPLSTRTTDDLAPHANPAALLTANERSILRHLTHGRNNSEIAHEMLLSESMVGTYLAEIYRKLHLPGRDAAVHLAKELTEQGEL
jgi:DNA-binding NarL/FixJ family response regulator